MNVDIASNQYRLWDAENVDTRHPSYIVLSPAFKTCTIVPSRGDLNIPFQYLGNLYFAETTATTQGGRCYQFSGPSTIGSFRGVSDSAVAGSLMAIHPVGADILHIINESNTNQEYIHRVGTLGGTPVRVVPTLPPTVDFAEIGDLSGTLHVLLYRKNIYHLYVGGGVLGSLEPVASIGDNIGSYIAPLVTDGVTMFANLPRGIYDFDITPDITIDTGRSQDINPRQVMFKNDLYFKNKKSLIHYDGSDVTPVGFDLEDGLPVEKLGEITAMASSWKYNFAAVQGGTYAHILAYDGKWHYYARMPSAGMWVKEMFLSDAPDAIDRLWCVYGNHPNPGYFLNPMVPPLQAATYSFVPTGHFTPPIFDGGMPEEGGAIYNMIVTTDGVPNQIMPTANQITCLYGINGDNPVTTLGVAQIKRTTLTFGSPYGLEAYRVQPQFVLYGKTEGSTPVYRNAVLHYLKLPDTREAFDFTVDLDKTAIPKVRPLEAVLGSLNSERDTKTLLPFWYGQVATKAVKVLDIPSTEEIEEDRVFQGERSGFVRVRVAEIL